MMNEIELQSITNGLAAVTGRIGATRERLAAGVSEPPSPAQLDRIAAAAVLAATQIRLLLEHLNGADPANGRAANGQWCWCGDRPEGQPPHNCAEDHAGQPACQHNGAHVHPYPDRTPR
jgi:hypothetical protein